MVMASHHRRGPGLCLCSATTDARPVPRRGAALDDHKRNQTGGGEVGHGVAGSPRLDAFCAGGEKAGTLTGRSAATGPAPTTPRTPPHHPQSPVFWRRRIAGLAQQRSLL